MTIPVSTAPSAIAAMTAQIQTQVNTDAAATAITVVTGEETTDSTDDLIVVATNVNRTVRHENFMGGLQYQSLEEDYTIDVLCSAWTGDPDPVTNMNRAWTLVGYVEMAVRTDPTLGGSVLIARPSGSKGGQSFWSDNNDVTGRQCDIIVSIFVDTLN
jgi:hypothetical protein